MYIKDEIARDFRMSDGDLMQLGDKAVFLMNRDAPELLAYGIDAVDITFITDKTLDFKNFSSDEVLEGAVMVATEVKNEAKEAVMSAIRAIMVRAQNAFGTDSSKYKSFASKGMNNMNDNDVYRLGKRVAETATLFLAELIPEGMTQAIIDELNVLTQTFDDTIDSRNNAVIARDIATNSRIKLGNELYDKIVKVFAAGRNYWISRNEAKYNDYVIYGASSPTPQPQVTIAMASKQNPPTPVNMGVIGTNGEEATANYGDSTTETKTVNDSTPTVFSHLHSSVGNYSMQMIATILALLEFYAPDCKISAINLPEGINLRVLDLMNNLLTSFFLPLSCVNMLNLQLNNNELDQQSVNALLIMIESFGTSGGQISIVGGTNATPSGQGIAAMNQLIQRGWTVVTN